MLDIASSSLLNNINNNLSFHALFKLCQTASFLFFSFNVTVAKPVTIHERALKDLIKRSRLFWKESPLIML